jgi:D-xylonolactonase
VSDADADADANGGAGRGADLDAEDLTALADRRLTVGEGPLWHPDEAVVYWLDIVPGHLYRYDPTTGDHARVHEADRPIGGYTIEADGSLLLFEGGGRIVNWAPEEGVREVLVDGLVAEADSRFNDVIADPLGRVFAGTMPTADREGRLYRVGLDGAVEPVDEGFAIPNGMGFAPDRSRMYLAVSDDRVIYAYDYDQASGALSARRQFVDTAGETGVPDGMTVDAEGYVWNARWNAGCVVRYDPDGVEAGRLAVPPPKASSLTFGGPDYRTVYLTTAVGEGDDADDHPAAGTLYRTRVGVRGLPEYRSRIVS